MYTAKKYDEMLNELLDAIALKRYLDLKKHTDSEKLALEKVRAVALKHERAWLSAADLIKRLAYDSKVKGIITQDQSFLLLSLIPPSENTHTFLQFLVNAVDLSSAQGFLAHLVEVGKDYKRKYIFDINPIFNKK